MIFKLIETGTIIITLCIGIFILACLLIVCLALVQIGLAP